MQLGQYRQHSTIAIEEEMENGSGGDYRIIVDSVLFRMGCSIHYLEGVAIKSRDLFKTSIEFHFKQMWCKDLVSMYVELL
jgi:hypothetical protein